MVIEPIKDWVVFFLIQIHLNSIKRFHIQDVVSIVQGWLFIIKGREPHSLEVSSVSLFPSHHDPHASPLCSVHRLNDLGHLIHKGDGPCDVIESLHSPHLLPRHGHVLQ